MSQMLQFKLLFYLIYNKKKKTTKNIMKSKFTNEKLACNEDKQ